MPTPAGQRLLRAARTTIHEEHPWGSSNPSPQPVEPAVFLRLPLRERVRILAIHWADDGSGTPRVLHTVYIIKTPGLHFGAGIWSASVMSGIEVSDVGSWYRNIVVHVRAAARAWRTGRHALNVRIPLPSSTWSRTAAARGPGPSLSCRGSTGVPQPLQFSIDLLVELRDPRRHTNPAGQLLWCGCVRLLARRDHYDARRSLILPRSADVTL
ncbi:DUF3556 domain-containing protein [Streptomyces sp. A108]|nr:DUF3556 domain-containing protein [Streptomyces sp. A108]